MDFWFMYITVALYTDWVWMCWVWFKALWCDCTADSVIEWFVYHHLCHNAGDCTADSVVKLFVCCCLCHGACWSVLTCGCTAAAGGTGYEAGGSGASLKTVNSELCDTVVCEINSGDVVGQYWHWGTETLEWSLCKA